MLLLMSFKMINKIILIPFIFLYATWSCNDVEVDYSNWESLTVTASAYNSIKIQGEGNPKITAWGDTLRPGVRSIAVSRDLLKKGLSYQTPVKIEGLDGIFIVNDKMHSRWRNKIDIYMGLEKEKALEWGRRKVVIRFPAEGEEDK